MFACLMCMLKQALHLSACSQYTQLPLYTYRRMQAELTNLRREMFRRQTLSFKGSRSRTQTDDIDSILPQPGTGTRQELEQQPREMQHLQQEVARLRQERDAARMQSNNGTSSSKQALNRKSGGALSQTPPGGCLLA